MLATSAVQLSELEQRALDIIASSQTLVSTADLAARLRVDEVEAHTAVYRLWDNALVGRKKNARAVEYWHAIGVKELQLAASQDGTEQMRFELRQVPIKDLLNLRSRILFPEYQRERDLWDSRRRTLLVGSILEGVDIPKLYFYEQVPGGELQCIDGGQRLTAIFSLMDGQMRHSDSRYWRDFSELDRRTFLEYPLTFSVITRATDEQLRQVFVRLQLGLPLSTAEKLHAEKGPLNDFASELVEQSPLFRQVGIATSRKRAQLVALHFAVMVLRRHEDGSFPDVHYKSLLGAVREFSSIGGADPALEEVRHVAQRMADGLGQQASLVKTSPEADVCFAFFLVHARENPSRLGEFFAAFVRDSRRFNAGEADASRSASDLGLVGRYCALAKSGQNGGYSITERLSIVNGFWRRRQK